MPRLTVLVSGLTLCLVASWAFISVYHQNASHTPPAPATAARIRLDEEALSELDEAAKRARAARLKAALKPPVENFGLLDRNGKEKPPRKRGGGPKSVNVDRKNIVETVEMDDLRAPPGRLWIPASLSGPINHGDGDPLRNVLVAYCQLDMKSYHESPWLYAMGPFHQRQSGCLDDKTLTRTYRLSSLKKLLEENPDEFMDPTGFIFHETRCGSTLSANMMAAIPSNIMHSETSPPIAILNICNNKKCPGDMAAELVRTVFRLMGPAQDGHTDMFFKFQSSKFVAQIEEAWPETKWIYLFRDPLEVMASNLKGAWRRQVRKEPTRPRNNNSTGPGYNLGGPCVRGVKLNQGAGKKPKIPSPKVLVKSCAAQLETLNEVVLTQIEGGSTNGLPVEYRQLPEVMTEYVYPEHFGMAKTEDEKAEFKKLMEPVTHVYSKGMGTPGEDPVSKEYEQGMDLEGKEEGTDERMRAAAATMCDNYKTLIDLQRWRKPQEGKTMGTCETR